MFQDATISVFYNLFPKRLSVVVPERFVPQALFNHFLVMFYAPMQTFVSGRKCQSFMVDPELLGIWSYTMYVQD